MVTSVVGVWRIVGAGDQRLQRWERSDRQGTSVLDSGDIGEQSRQAGSLLYTCGITTFPFITSTCASVLPVSCSNRAVVSDRFKPRVLSLVSVDVLGFKRASV